MKNKKNEKIKRAKEEEKSQDDLRPDPIQWCTVRFIASDVTNRTLWRARARVTVIAFPLVIYCIQRKYCLLLCVKTRHT